MLTLILLLLLFLPPAAAAQPFAMALEEFRHKLPQRRPRHRRCTATDQHILFVTDGQPTSGDRFVAQELALAQAFGVAVHTIFIGYDNCPAVLDRLSTSTGGSRFTAYFDVRDHSIKLVDRALGGQPWKKDQSCSTEQKRLETMSKIPALFKRYADSTELEQENYMW